MELQAVLFDFHGVLSHDRFYAGSVSDGSVSLYERMQTVIYGNPDGIIHKWMRGKIDFRGFHARVAPRVGVTPEELDHALEDSVRRVHMDQDVLELAARCRARGIKTAVVSDNMDVFTLWTTPAHRLAVLFDVVSNSADCGLLKNDEHGRVFDDVLGRLGVRIDQALLIDDTLANIELFRAKGGQSCQYTSAMALRDFLEQALTELYFIPHRNAVAGPGKLPV